MFKYSIKLSELSIVALIAASGCAYMPSRPIQAENTVAKSDWTAALPKAMSAEYCDPDTGLTKCYSISTEDCKQRFESFTVSCEQSLGEQIPSELRLSETRVWGGRIGSCAKAGMLRVLESENAQPLSLECRQEVLQM